MQVNIQIPVAELQKHNVFVATPMYGGQCFGSYTKSILDLSAAFNKYQIQSKFSFLFNESLITRARNYLADEFLRSECTHLMFLDSDIDFNPMDVIALLAIDKPIVGGPYPKKTISWENVYDAAALGIVPRNEAHKLADFAGDFVFNAVPGQTEIALNKPAEVLEIGTGFMMVKREVFKAFSDKWPEYWYTPDHNRSNAFDGSRKIYQYFQAEIEPKQNRYLSEDYWFCQKAREAGQPVWLAPWMQIKHHGTYIYTGSIPAMATVANERVKRGMAHPSVVKMDAPLAPTAANVQKLTVNVYTNLAEADKLSVLKSIAEKHSTTPDELKVKIDAKIEEWAATIGNLSLEEAVEDLLAA